MSDAKTFTSRSETLDYLGRLQAQYSTYHSQKETGTWTGVVLYVTVLLIFLGATNLSGSISHQVLAPLLIFALTVFVFIYVSSQRRLRLRAGFLVSACITLQADIAAENIVVSDISV